MVRFPLPLIFGAFVFVGGRAGCAMKPIELPRQPAKVKAQLPS